MLGVPTVCWCVLASDSLRDLVQINLAVDSIHILVLTSSSENDHLISADFGAQ